MENIRDFQGEIHGIAKFFWIHACVAKWRSGAATFHALCNFRSAVCIVRVQIPAPGIIPAIFIALLCRVEFLAKCFRESCRAIFGILYCVFFWHDLLSRVESHEHVAHDIYKHHAGYLPAHRAAGVSLPGCFPLGKDIRCWNGTP